jgi:Flp pilus assembly pilin Flp
VKLFKSQAKKIRGQGMSEYVIIVALIAVAAIAVTGLFGGAARNQFAGIANELAGENGNTAIGQAKTAATAASTESAKNRNLSNYNAQKDVLK